MEFTGTLKVILPERSGVSQKTNKPWRSQDIVVALDHGRWVESYLFTMFNKDLNAKEGDTVTVTFDGEAREHNGRYYNSLNVFKIERAPQAAPSTPSTPSGNSGISGLSGTTSGPSAAATETYDDIPF